MWRYRYKTKPDGSLEKRSAQCAVRGDLMRPGVHYDDAKTNVQSPSYATQRLLYANAALEDHDIESWDVPSAYPRADTDPNFQVFLRQPKRANGTYTHLGCHFEICKAHQGAPDAGHRWEKHRDFRLVSLGWTRIRSEPDAFIRTNGKHSARLLASTDDFLVSCSDPVFLSTLRHELQLEWDITIQDQTATQQQLHMTPTTTCLDVALKKLPYLPKTIRATVPPSASLASSPTPSATK
eukprot:Plantae.Rhodophyta-Palmaria_palmata.ctg6789.p1 GENE.Plantae.Rhodophyta-Palmaria_palmata.ctg6789~~Plantae.Rhodophyta-Palmaria_palmata.ctg6789.p1  ORF type:complete len:238 (+),score=3.70 Plantae.Rhodophyta-Palmaria_palmata.ctg6789:464-1177(+)